MIYAYLPVETCINQQKDTKSAVGGCRHLGSSAYSTNQVRWKVNKCWNLSETINQSWKDQPLLGNSHDPSSPSVVSPFTSLQNAPMGLIRHVFLRPNLRSSRASERTPWNLLLRARKWDGAPVTGAPRQAQWLMTQGSDPSPVYCWQNPIRTPWQQQLWATHRSTMIYLQGLLMKAQERETAAIWRDTRGSSVTHSFSGFGEEEMGSYKYSVITGR